jgi:hypothetical protein
MRRKCAGRRWIWPGCLSSRSGVKAAGLHFRDLFVSFPPPIADGTKRVEGHAGLDAPTGAGHTHQICEVAFAIDAHNHELTGFAGDADPFAYGWGLYI